MHSHITLIRSFSVFYEITYVNICNTHTHTQKKKNTQIAGFTGNSPSELKLDFHQGALVGAVVVAPLPS